MNKIKRLWYTYGGWCMVALPVVVLALCLAASAAKPEQRIQAEPPAETVVTFDMDKNRAYTAEDGVVVIGRMITPTAAKTDASPLVAAVETAAEESLNNVTATAKIGGAYTLPEDAQLSDGSIGLLSIPKLKLSVNVFETDDEMEAMSHGLAPQGQFYTTSRIKGK